jgi:hypothetical protein
LLHLTQDHGSRKDELQLRLRPVQVRYVGDPP